jgi:hypothetical protein
MLVDSEARRRSAAQRRKLNGWTGQDRHKSDGRCLDPDVLHTDPTSPSIRVEYWAQGTGTMQCNCRQPDRSGRGYCPTAKKSSCRHGLTGNTPQPSIGIFNCIIGTQPSLLALGRRSGGASSSGVRYKRQCKRSHGDLNSPNSLNRDVNIELFLKEN